MNESPLIIQEFQSYLAREGITQLYPHQQEALRVLSTGSSLLLATPTSSGKTVVAYYGILRAWKMGLRSLYVVPLRALAEEKYEDMKLFEDFGIRVGISTGDYDRPSDYLKRYDVLISTSEKVDSILRNNPFVLDRMGFFVFDEIHNIGDESRGSTLEIVISKIRHMIRGAQFAAMSATVSNVDRIADWLGATAVATDFRPVQLRKFVLTSSYVIGEDGKVIRPVQSFEDVVTGSLSDSGQSIVFVKSRKAAETVAAHIAPAIGGILTADERKALEEVETDADTPGSDKLSLVLKKGVGFHHAGMTSEQRRLVENLFRERKIKVIAATTTLAAGMNLPARSVFIKDIYRYNGFSSGLIPNMEVQQMLGRAGRAKYDSIGYGYVCSPDQKISDVFSVYIRGVLESISSTIDERKLRMHVLGLISSEMGNDLQSINSFFATTLAHHEGKQLGEWIDNSIVFLQDNDMIIGGRSFAATSFGRKVSELYVDPVSGVILRNASRLTDTSQLLMGISATPDMQGLYVSSDDSIAIPGDLPFHIAPEQAKVSRILEDWIAERPESEIVEKYSVWPADIRSRVDLAEWLSHSLYEISRVLAHRGRPDLQMLNRRIKYGIGEDLVELISIPNVGRVRARRLMINGFDTVESIANAAPGDVRKMERLQGFGEKVTEGIVRDAWKVIGKRDAAAAGREETAHGQ